MLSQRIQSADRISFLRSSAELRESADFRLGTLKLLSAELRMWKIAPLESLIILGLRTICHSDNTE